MSDDQRSVYLEGAHDDSGICSSCGHWFPPSEYGQEWRAAHPDTATYCEQCHSEAYEPDGDDPQY